MKLLYAMPLVIAAIAPQLHSQEAPAPPALPMRDAATHEQLSLTYRRVSQQDPMRKMEPTKGPDPSKVNQPLDLISQSDILCFGEMATLVPKRAILHIPAKFSERLKFLPGSKILSWAAFFAENRGWITTVEVSRVQAEGNQPLAQDVTERLKDSANLVVATYLGGPISVLPLKVPPPAEAPAETPAAATRTNKQRP